MNVKYKMYLYSCWKSFFEGTLTCVSVQRFLRLSFFSILSLCVLLFGAVAPVDSADVGKPHGISVKVLWIIDGDSVEVLKYGKKMTVRLYGIDTPEWKQPYSGVAKKYLHKEISNKHIEIVPFYRDKYGRTIAIARHENRIINEVLVERGMAWVHIYYCKKPICAKWKNLEKDARTSRRGLWQQKNPVPPWVWKKSH